mgnify:CR=1 FL=1
MSPACRLQGDLLLLAAGPRDTVHRALDRVRQLLGRDLGLIKVRERVPGGVLIGRGLVGMRPSSSTGMSDSGWGPFGYGWRCIRIAAQVVSDGSWKQTHTRTHTHMHTHMHTHIRRGAHPKLRPVLRPCRLCAQPGDHSLLWVVDFPMFEFNPEEGRYQVRGQGGVRRGREKGAGGREQAKRKGGAGPPCNIKFCQLPAMCQRAHVCV